MIEIPSSCVGDFGENLVFSFYDDWDYTAFGNFKSTLVMLDIIRASDTSLQKYCDIHAGTRCPITDDTEIEFSEVKTTCVYDFNKNGVFRIKIDKKKISDYSYFDMRLKLAIASDLLPEKTNYKMWVVRKDGIWYADMSDVIQSHTFINGFMVINGCFNHWRTLSVSESIEFSTICRDHQKFIRKSSKIKGKSYGLFEDS